MEPFRPPETNPINDATADMPPKQDSDLAETDMVKEDHHVSANEIQTPSLRPPPRSSVGGGDTKSDVLEELEKIETSMLNYAYAITGHRQDSEDVVSISKIKAIRAYQTYERKNGAQFKTWVLGIVKNQALNVLRERKRRPTAIITDAQMQTLIGGSEPIEKLLREEASQLFNETLAKLTERERTLISLRMEGLTHEEIGQLLHLSQLASAKAFQRALVRFRETYPNSQNGAE